MGKWSDDAGIFVLIAQKYLEEICRNRSCDKFAILLSLTLLCILNSEVNAGFFYKSAAEREKLVQAERAFTDQRVQKVIDFKKKMCDGTDKKFVLINQKVRVSNIDTYRYSCWLAVTDGRSVGVCSRLSQPTWLVSAL